MKKDIEILVIGAGPAGLSAAIEAAKCGAEVLVVDENNKPGGQLFKQIHKFFSLLCPVCGARRYDGSRDIFIHSESPERDSGLCRSFDSRIFRARSADRRRRVLRRRVHSGADNEIHSLR